MANIEKNFGENIFFSNNFRVIYSQNTPLSLLKLQKRNNCKYGTWKLTTPSVIVFAPPLPIRTLWLHPWFRLILMHKWVETQIGRNLRITPIRISSWKKFRWWNWKWKNSGTTRFHVVINYQKLIYSSKFISEINVRQISPTGQIV